MTKGDFKDINKALKEHGVMAVIIGGAAYFIIGGKAMLPGASNGGDVHEFSADVPPQNNLQGYMKQPSAPEAHATGGNQVGFDPHYKSMGV